eukprot:4943565-Amphidinium_carterae.1
MSAPSIFAAWPSPSLALDQFDLVSFRAVVTLPQLLEADRQLFVIAAGMLKRGSIAKDGDVQPVYLSPVPKDVRKRVPEGSASSSVRSDSERVRPASSGSKGGGRSGVR